MLQEKIGCYLDWLRQRGVHYPTLDLATKFRTVKTVSQHLSPTVQGPILPEGDFSLTGSNPADGIVFFCGQAADGADATALVAKVLGALAAQTSFTWASCRTSTVPDKLDILSIARLLNGKLLVLMGDPLVEMFCGDFSQGSHLGGSDSKLSCVSNGWGGILHLLKTFPPETYIRQPAMKRDLWKNLLSAAQDCNASVGSTEA